MPPRCVVVVMFSASVFASIAQYLGQHRLPVCVVGCCVVCCVCVLCVCVVCPWFLSVAIAVGSRPVPFRTRKLSLPAPMVLHSGGCGRVGHRRHLNFMKRVGDPCSACWLGGGSRPSSFSWVVNGVPSPPLLCVHQWGPVFGPGPVSPCCAAGERRARSCFRIELRGSGPRPAYLVGRVRRRGCGRAVGAGSAYSMRCWPACVGRRRSGRGIGWELRHGDVVERYLRGWWRDTVRSPARAPVVGRVAFLGAASSRQKSP